MIQLLPTSDGSTTLFNDELNETYHSTHGALQESMHVFIENGLRKRKSKDGHFRILEVGFGTGLNALLALRETQQEPNLHIDYVSLEPYPLQEEIFTQLNYAKGEELDSFLAMHRAPVNQRIQLSSAFSFTRSSEGIATYNDEALFDIVFYDAFGPPTQPELWTTDVLKCSVDLLKEKGIWVTYCSKGDVRRSLISLGMEMQRLDGPPGKRHMLFGVKASG
ncbi:MAG: hypothetical protein RLZZ543_140 [Bacteroidota bacterium]|jgi:tRNA U34 5-methylaminomethyl-2-thiouridine-forming methyltransferase MnmC